MTVKTKNKIEDLLKAARSRATKANNRAKQIAKENISIRTKLRLRDLFLKEFVPEMLRRRDKKTNEAYKVIGVLVVIIIFLNIIIWTK